MLSLSSRNDKDSKMLALWTVSIRCLVMMIMMMMMTTTTTNAWVLRLPPSTPTLSKTRSSSSSIRLYNHHRRRQLLLQSLDNHSLSHDEKDKNDNFHSERRRSVLNQMFFVVGVGVGVTTSSCFLGTTPEAVAATTSPAFTILENGVYRRQTEDKKLGGFGYEFTPPPSGFEATQKPLKTHLDEYTFKNTNGAAATFSKYEYGITVDPVRINSITELGTPEEVAAKVVLAEVNRDGIFDVKLMQDAVLAKEEDNDNDDDDDEYYIQLNYLSSGKRGDKRFVAKFFVKNQKLYVLTAQCKESDYPQLESELLQAVKSFRVL